MNYKKTDLAESPGSSATSCESEVSIEKCFPSASSTRLNSTPQTPCPQAPDKYKTLSVICGFAYKGPYEKFRISEDSRAKIFLSATVFFCSDVFIRTCDLQDINNLFGADLYCHKNCINSYILKHVKAQLYLKRR